MLMQLSELIQKSVVSCILWLVGTRLRITCVTKPRQESAAGRTRRAGLPPKHEIKRSSGFVAANEQ